jgi:hypothetical protein
MDLITKAHDPRATTGIVFDDQHEIDTVFFFDGIATLAQIKASPLVLLPVVVDLNAPLTGANSPDTGLPVEQQRHSFVGIPTATHNLALYLPVADRAIPLGPKNSPDWPYVTFRQQLDRASTLDLLEHWLRVFEAFAIPKRAREGDQVRLAWLTAGWGAPIDDNKTKAGLARSDNMMKGTYACLKYGAYYSQDCVRGTIRNALISNIDPAHQYEEYLRKIEDIRWGHAPDFVALPGEAGRPQMEVIRSDRLEYLFDSVFTFNRQILNDEHARRAWNLDAFAESLVSNRLADLLAEWKRIPV